MTHEPGVRDFLEQGRPYGRKAGLIAAVGTLLVAIVVFVWPATYTARTTLLPPTSEETGFSVAALVRGLSIPGITVPGRSGPEDVAVSVLESRRLRETLIERFDLREVYDVEKTSAAARILGKRSSFKIDPSGTIVIEVKDRSAERAADLANAYVEELDRFNREIRMTKGRRMRLFVEERLEETQREMAGAELALQRYQREHSAVALTPEQASTVESGARLFARQASLRVQLGMVRQFASENSEEVQRIRRELESVNRQIGTLPDVGIELARLMRELKIQEQVYALLSAQYEEARINEARDVATLEVLDPAVTPDKRSWPRRGLLIVLGLVLSTALALGWVALQIPRARSAP